MYSPLAGMLPYAGCYGGNAIINGTIGWAQVGAAIFNKRDIFPCAYCMTTNAGGTFYQWGAFPLPWNVVEVDYAVWPQGSTLVISTNLNGGAGGYAAISGTISTIGSKTNVGHFYWTNSAGPQIRGLQFASTIAGTNAVFSVACWNSTITNGFMTGSVSDNAADHLDYTVSGPGSNIMSQLYATWQPDIVFLQDLDYATDMATNLPLFVRMVTNACPNTKIVFCATYPDLIGPTEGALEAATMQSVARRTGQA
jgi:hypothetical protein